MKTRSILTAALIGFGLLAQAQWINSNRLKTANNGAGGIISPLNTATDLYWDASVTSINTGYVDARRVFTSGWMTTPYPDVDWIAYPHGCNTDQSQSWCPSGANLDEYFRVTFDIGSCGQYCLNYTAWADNCIYKMYLNNTTTPFYTTGATSPYWNYGFRAADSINGTICTGFVPGTNTLYVHVKSGHNPTSGNTGLLFRGMPGYYCPFLSYGGGGDPQGKQAVEQQQQIDDLKSLLEVMTGGAIKPASTQVSLSDKNRIVLDQNVPNPFAESTEISYNIPRSFTKAQILFFTFDGKIIKTVDIQEPGRNTLQVFASDLSKGMYSYKLVVDGETIDAKKMIKE